MRLGPRERAQPGDDQQHDSTADLGRWTREPERGAAAVEFALVSVLLLTLLFGIVQYAFYFYQSQGASATSREAARLAAVGVTSCATFKAAVRARAAANGTDIEAPASSNIHLTVTKDSGNVGSNPEIGDNALVVVRWEPLKFGFPFVPFLTGNENAESQTRIESVGTLVGLTC